MTTAVAACHRAVKKSQDRIPIAWFIPKKCDAPRLQAPVDFASGKPKIEMMKNGTPIHYVEKLIRKL
jgi:hypothetical protein